MSTADVIHDVSQLLRDLLRKVGAEMNPPLSVNVTIDSPHRGNLPVPRLNLFLFNVGVDEERRNTGWVPLGYTPGEPKIYRPDPQAFVPEPLALKLRYLVTAFADDGLTEHRLLGHAMQVLYEHQRIPAAELPSKSERVRAEYVDLVLLGLNVDEMQKIWGQSTEFLRASVAYEVDGLYLEASGVRQVPLVKKVNDDVEPMVSAGEIRQRGRLPFPPPA